MNKKSEKENRKRLLEELESKAKQEFEQNLPMHRTSFEKLFDYLDTELCIKDCDGSVSLTQSFLERNNIENQANILVWLNKNGGHCDCEILANVEDQFE